jgi:hypothetical protein
MKWKWFIVITALAMLPLFSLLTPGLPVTHDGQDHVARIANFYTSLTEGIGIPRWGGNLNWGYGHPVMMFLYPLPSYIASGFHALGFGLIDSYKLVFAATFIISMWGMYLWAHAVWGWEAGLVASVLYGFAPYRFIDMYVRGAIGEHVAFACIGFILWGIYSLARNKTLYPLHTFAITGGTAALILSHNAVSLMFLPIIFLYGLYVFFFEAKRSWKFVFACALSIGWGFGLSAFFWIPAFFEGKYTLRDIVTDRDFATRYVNPISFIASTWNYGGGNEFSKTLGLAQLVGMLVALASLFSLKRHAKILLYGLFAVLGMSIFLMTGASISVWKIVTILQKFQFPWRLLSISTLVCAIIPVFAIDTLEPKLRKWVAYACVLLAVLGTMQMWKPKEYRIYPESFFTSVYHGTTDTGESSPIWSVRFMEKERTGEALEVIDGDAVIYPRDRSSTQHGYAVTVTKPTRFVENTLYFPGWKIYVDGKLIPIEFQDSRYRGLMTFTLDPGEWGINVVFERTNLRKVAELVSLIALVSYLLVVGTMRIWQAKRTI